MRRRRSSRTSADTLRTLLRLVSRSFTLPEGIDGEHVGAELKDGVLWVTIPKKPELKPRKIELKLDSGAAKAHA